MALLNLCEKPNIHPNKIELLLCGLGTWLLNSLMHVFLDSVLFHGPGHYK